MKRLLKISVLLIILIAILESLLFIIPIRTYIKIENKLGRVLIPAPTACLLPLESYALIWRLRLDKLKEDKIVSYGENKLFYRREPGYEFKQSYESLPAYTRIIDETGFSNENSGWYDSNKKIPIFISGDSVIQGVGMPSVVELLKKMGFAIWNLSTGSYSPAEKVQAIKEFALKKNPKLIILEFYSGNDASEAIEDSLCARYGYAFYGRFHTKTMLSFLSKTSPYKDYYVKDSPITGFLKNNSITYFLLNSLANSFKTYCYKLIHPRKNSNQKTNFSQIRIAKPAYANFPIKEDKKLLWMKEGMAITLSEYEKLLNVIDFKTTQLVILYNPSSYEIYRKNLPKELVDSTSDIISDFQRKTVRDFCNTHQIAFWDITEQLQNVYSNEKRICGNLDAVHWTEFGTEQVSLILKKLIEKEYPHSAGKE